MKPWMLGAALAALLAAGCESVGYGDTSASADAKMADADDMAAGDAMMKKGDAMMASGFDGDRLAAVVAARSAEERARDDARHPYETLEFFGLAPTDTVVEVLPGGGWYSRVIGPYVAADGRYVGVNYAYDMFPQILPGGGSPEQLANLKVWAETFPAQAAGWADFAAPVTAFEFGKMPADMAGAVDAVIAVRAMHNFNRAADTSFRDQAIADMYAMLKPGGVLGVVQHRADAGDAVAADGSRGYMDERSVVAMFEEAGFVLEERSEINANPADIVAADEFVWRLPPTLALGETNRDAYMAIGESDRMTLRFRKAKS